MEAKRPGSEMTDAQFDCCLASRSGEASAAARLVLVQGLTVAAAAQQARLAEKTIRNAMSRIRKRHEQIVRAYCGGATSMRSE